MLPEYKLSTTLEGHSQDVRALLAPSPKLIISASRDASAKVWELQKDGMWMLTGTMNDPDGKFVSSLAWVVVDEQAYIACGSGSSHINLFPYPPTSSTSSLSPQRLSTHAQNVCCLDASAALEDGTLISGSWDCTAVVWDVKSGRVVVKFEGHEKAVWGVRVVGGGKYLSASADKTIRLFDSTGSTLSTFFGHTDCVRSISLLPDLSGFYSASNDSTVLKWSFQNDKPIKTLSGHNSFVYSVESLPLEEGEGCVSSGEDGTLRVWLGDKPTQTIIHPTISVWVTSTLPNGDILSGSSDSTIRIFTRDEKRVASDDILEIWDMGIRNRQLNKNMVDGGQQRTTDLPGLEALGRGGKKEGEVIMVKNEGKVEAYQWQSSTTTWQQIGEVVDAVKSGEKKMYKGKEYDYVFEVDIADGVPPLKLPYNVNENPYFAAERFLNANELPQSYTEQIVKFIHSNTEGVTIGSGGDGGPIYVDPFTGAGAYTGSGGGSGSGSGSRRGGTGADSKGGAGGAGGAGGGYRDPFTGGGAYTTQPSESTKKDFTPIKVPQYYKQINVNAVKGKIAEFKDSDPACALTLEESNNLDEIFAHLSLPTSILSQTSSSSEHYNPTLFLSTLLRWPSEKRFPLIDVARVLCGISGGISEDETKVSLPTGMGEENVIGVLLDACGWEQDWVDVTKARENNTMLVMRGLANLTSTKEGKKRWGDVRGVEMLDRLAGSNTFEKMNKNTRVAYASIALNLSVLAAENELPKALGQPLLRLITNILSNESTDSEVTYRTLIALGNLTTSRTVSGSLSVGDVQLAKEIGMGLADRLGEERLKAVVKGL